MKIGSSLQYEVPDNCKGCLLRPESFDQGNICFRCPVFNCRVTTIEGEDFRLVNPEDFRDDWAKEWERAFKEKDAPILALGRLSRPKNNNR